MNQNAAAYKLYLAATDERATEEETRFICGLLEQIAQNQNPTPGEMQRAWKLARLNEHADHTPENCIFERAKPARTTAEQEQ